MAPVLEHATRQIAVEDTCFILTAATGFVARVNRYHGYNGFGDGGQVPVDNAYSAFRGLIVGSGGIQALGYYRMWLVSGDGSMASPVDLWSRGDDANVLVGVADGHSYVIGQGGEGGFAADELGYVTVAPRAAADVEASAWFADESVVTWTGDATGEVHYVVVRSGPGGTATFTVNANEGNNEGEAYWFVDPGLTPEEHYSYTVTTEADNGMQASAASVGVDTPALAVQMFGGTVTEGEETTLYGYANAAGNVTFSWDLNNDDTFETTGDTATFDATGYSGLSGAVTVPIGLKATLGTDVVVADPNPEVTVLDIGPAVTGMVLDGAPVSGNVNYRVTFNEAVSGVDTTDFAVATTGTVTGASVVSVSAVGGTGSPVASDTWEVTVHAGGAGAGWGTVRLDLHDDDTIVNSGNHSLGGQGEGNGDAQGDTLEPAIAIGDGATVVEGNDTTLSLGTDVFTAPTWTVWTIDWGDGSDAEDVTGATPTVAHEYASGLGDYTVTVTADAPADANGAYGEVALAAAYKEVKVVPAAPDGFSATAGEVSGTVHLEWDASTSAIATGYRILLDDGGGAGPQVVADAIAPDATTFDMSMLAAGTYTVALQLVSEGGASAAASVANVTVAPYVPPLGGGPGGTAVHSASSGSLATNTPNSAANAYLGFAINFYGIHTDQIYVDEDGIVGVPTGNSSDLSSPWQSMADREAAVIAPYWSETSLEPLRGEVPGGNVTYGATTWHDDATDKDFGAFHVVWADMYNWATGEHESLYNTFELYLVNRADTGAGNFDIVFVYDDIEWSVAEGGTYAARYGYSRGLPDVSGSYKESGGPIRNPQYTLTVTDTVSEASLSDTDNDPARPGGILGAVTSQDDGLGHLNIALTQTGGDNLVWPLYWTAVDASPTPGNGTFTPTGSEDVKVGPSANAWTVKVTNLFDPAFERDIKVFVATVDIVWNGAGNLIDVGGDGTQYNDPNATVYGPNTVLSRKGPINIFAGQHVKLAYETNLAANNIIMRRWDLGGTADDLVTSYQVSDAHPDGKGEVKKLGSAYVFQAEPDFYPAADALGRRFAIDVWARVGGRGIHFTNYTTFNVHKPGQSIWKAASPVAGDPNEFHVKGEVLPARMEVVAGEDRLFVETTPRTTLPWPVTEGYVGQADFVQVVCGKWWATGPGLLGANYVSDTGNRWKLDTKFPYNDVHGVLGGPFGMGDAPDIKATSGSATDMGMQLEFQTWLIWKPPGEGIYVPIQSWRWTVNEHVTRASTGALWSGIPAGGVAVPLSASDTEEFPTWRWVYRKRDRGP